MTMLCCVTGAPLTESTTFATHSGCAYTAPSTGHENSLPKVAVFTLAAVSAYSWALTPSRARSLCQVETAGRSVTPMVTDAWAPPPLTLVAVRVYTPAVDG